MSDLIDRQAAIDAPERFTKDCNPEHFVGHQNFIEYMDNAEIGSFGNWQFANGFNMGLTAAEVAIKELPSAETEPHYCRECKWSRCNISIDKHGETETYWHCLNWDGETDEEGFCHEWKRRTDETD